MPAFRSDSVGTRDIKKSTEISGETFKSLDNAIRETNQEILYELITKKIKEFFHRVDIDKLTHEQLKLHTKMITESVTDQFQSLKSAANITLIQSRVGQILKRLRNAKNAQNEDSAHYLNLPKEQMRTKPVVDYLAIEIGLVRSYDQCLEKIKNIRESILLFNKQYYKLNSQLKPLLQQVCIFF